MSADPFQIVAALVTAVQNLTSDDNYKKIAGIFDEIPLLKEQIASKDTELDSLRNDITRNLEVYRTQYNKLEDDNIKLSEKISTLEAEIKEKTVTTAKHDEAQNELRRQLDEVKDLLAKEKENVTKANEEITNLQQNLKSKDTDMDGLKESLNDSKTQVSDSVGQLKQLQKEYSSVQKTLESKTTRLNEFEGFLKNLGQVDDQIWIPRLDAMWESAHRLVEDHFKEDLSAESFKGLDTWKKFGDSLVLNHLPLPRSNSLAAKHMRIAALLAILTRCIDQHIFQPTYILEEDDEIRQLLVNLATTNSQKESICRALLLSIDPEKQAKNALKRRVQATREIAWYIQDVLSPVKYETFMSRLDQVVQEALEIWQIAQCATDKFEPLFVLNDIHYEDFDWQLLKFGENVVSDGEQSAGVVTGEDEELLVIFPRIYSIEDNEPYPINTGVALMRSQSVAAAEEVELERKKPSSPKGGKVRPNRFRPKALSFNGENNFFPQSPPTSA